MKIFGTLREIVDLVYRRNGWGVTVKPNTAQTFSADSTFQLPNSTGYNDDTLVGETSPGTLRNKTLEQPAVKGAVSNEQGKLNFFEGSQSGTNKITVQSPLSVTSDWTLTLPSNTGDANQVLRTDGTGVADWAALSNASIAPAAGIEYTKLNLASSIVDGDIATAAAIARSKLASGTASHVIINDGSGVLSSEAQLAKSRGGAGQDMSGVTFPSTGTLVTRDATETLLNKTTVSSTAAATGALKLPTGNSTTERPTGTASALKGMVRYNDTDDTFEGYNELSGWSSLGGGGTTDRVTQASHGFVVGDVLYMNGSTYTKAIATSAAASEVVGVVSRFIDSSTFELTLSGEVSGFTGLTPGEVYFLSPSSAGALTVTEPTVLGQVSVPVGVASSATSLYVAPKRGVVVGGTNARTELSLLDVNTAQNIQDMAAYEAGEITGWLYLDATTDLRFYVAAQFSRGGNGNYNISYQTSGDTPPTGFAVSITNAGMIQITLKSSGSATAGFSSCKFNYALNAPAVGATFPLSIDSTSVAFTDIKASTASGLAFKEDGGTTIASASDAGAWTFGPSAGIGSSTHTINGRVNLPYVSAGETVRFGGGTTNAANRDWGIGINYDAYGEFSFRCSTAQEGNPFTAGSSFGKISNAGAWTLGPSSSSTLTHSVNGAFSNFVNHNGKHITTLTNNGNGSNVTNGTIAGELAFATRHGGAINDVSYIRGTYEGNGTTRSGSLQFVTYASGTPDIRGSLSSAGAWTFGGLSNRLATSHNFNGTVAGYRQEESVEAVSFLKSTATNSSSQIFARFYINNYGGGCGSIVGNGSGQAAFASFSDARLKENIEPLSGELDKLMQLKPCEFDFKDGSGHQIGFIAQEIESIYPDSVSYLGDESDEMKMVSGWDKTAARLVKAIQELKAELDATKAELETLKNKP